MQRPGASGAASNDVPVPLGLNFASEVTQHMRRPHVSGCDDAFIWSPALVPESHGDMRWARLTV